MECVGGLSGNSSYILKFRIIPAIMCTYTLVLNILMLSAWRHDVHY